MKKFITSDLHFSHKNIQRFCPKTRSRFSDVDDMDATMILEWNAIVSPEDTVYILGDVAFCNTEKAISIVNQLQGKKILIEGNHDQKALKDQRYKACFHEVHKYLDIMHNGNMLVMFHYPIAEWDRMHRGSIHFHGHLHGSTSGLEAFRARDVGMDATGNIVTLLDDAIADALLGKIKVHH